MFLLLCLRNVSVYSFPLQVDKTGKPTYHNGAVNSPTTLESQIDKLLAQ